MKGQVLSRFTRVSSDLVCRLKNPNSIPVVYFTGQENVGDLLNEYIIPRVSGKQIIKVSSSFGPHLRAIGSVIGSSSQHSYIWGSGSIDGKRPERILDKRKIFALRGEKTKNLIEKSFNMKLDGIPLGDPAILMPMFYRSDEDCCYSVGIVPHFSDEARLKELVNGLRLETVKIISVGQEPESFVSEILSCEYIISSSLHGLILADAYNIPNLWIKVSGNLLGGNFKFQDYYSVMDSGIDAPMIVSESSNLRSILNRPSNFCRVSYYLHCKNDILESFPEKYIDKVR